jgi:hypothetical protein
MTDAEPTIQLPAYTRHDNPEPAASPRSPRLGLVAMMAGIAILIVSVTLAIVIGTAAGPYATRSEGGGFGFFFSPTDPNPTISALATAMMLHVLLGTGVGLWALIQGIVATAQNRGRRFGIVAIITAALAPGLSLIVLFVSVGSNLPPV